MKLKYFYRIDQKGKPIPASNVRRKSRPFEGKWRELLNACCSPQTIPCKCGFKYFVQLDGNNNPVDHTLIKRYNKADKLTGFNFMEVTWVGPCCI